jgi:hypothetical protein
MCGDNFRMIDNNVYAIIGEVNFRGEKGEAYLR